MARFRLRYITSDRDRHGNVRYYFRKRGMPRKIRMPGLPGSNQFMAAYSAALAGAPLPATETQPAQRPIVKDANCFEWLCDQYKRSPEFLNSLTKLTQTGRDRMLASICNEPLSDARTIPIGHLPYAQITSKAIRQLRDRRASTPHGANSMLKSLKVLMKWAVEAGYLDSDPAKDVARIATPGEGHHTWSTEEVKQYEECHAIGTRARLALALLMYTGQRRSDIVKFGRQHVKGDMLIFTQQKNEKRKPVTLTLKILPALVKIIEATPSDNLTFLVNDQGQPFTPSHFGKTFRKWCDEAGLEHCTSHGLRKAGATIAAERGATQKQLMAIFGWSSISQVQLYTRRSEQAKLAADAMHYLNWDENKTDTNVSHLDCTVEKGETKTRKKV